MRPTIVTLFILEMILSVSCMLDDNRCGSFEWDPISENCIQKFDTGGSDSEPNDGGVIDGGEDSEDSSPIIMGQPCQSDAECDEYNTNYCNLAADEPFCTFKDCTALPDGCPSGYSCCVSISPDWYPDHCMQEEIYEQVKELLCVI
jgi:hypothetical protein